jgi:hypothetical protein
MLKLRDAAVAGDVNSTMATLHSSRAGGQELVEAAARLFVALEAVKAATRERLGLTRDLGEVLPGFASVLMIEHASVFVDGDRAELRFAPEHAGPAELYPLNKVDGQWKLDVARLNLEDDANLQANAKLAIVLAHGVEQVTPKIETGEIPEGIDPMEFATSEALGRGMGLKPGDLDAVKRQLATMQADRQAKRWAGARKAATAPANAPTSAPALPARIDTSTPLAAARAFADAIARGDRDTARALAERGTPAADHCADGMVEEELALYEIRAAAIERLGRDEAMRLPMNDCGAGFSDRFELGNAEGDRATVRWRDNFKTPTNPEGTTRSIGLVRTESGWRLPTKSRRDADGNPITETELFDEGTSAQIGARKARQIAAEIRERKLQTFEQIQHARRQAGM